MSSTGKSYRWGGAVVYTITNIGIRFSLLLSGFMIIDHILSGSSRSTSTGKRSEGKWELTGWCYSARHLIQQQYARVLTLVSNSFSITECPLWKLLRCCPPYTPLVKIVSSSNLRLQRMCVTRSLRRNKTSMKGWLNQILQLRQVNT